jgi:hypothetical protein
MHRDICVSGLNPLCKLLVPIYDFGWVETYPLCLASEGEKEDNASNR